MLLKEIGNAIKNAVNSVVNAVASVFSGGSSSSGGSSGGGGSNPPSQTVNPSGNTSTNNSSNSTNSTPTSVTVDNSQVFIRDSAGNVVATYFRDHMKDDLQRLAQLQQNAVKNPTPVNIEAAINFAEKIKKDYKEFFEATKDKQGGVSVIGLRGWGVGYPCHDTKNIKSNDIYDDMLIVLGTDGAIDVFTRCNFEGTTAVGTYNEGKSKLTGNYPSIADGVYELNATYHGKENPYYALTLENDGRVPTIGENPVYPKRGNPGYAILVHIHKGGDSWTYSEGCITIYAPSNDTSRWDRFISRFPEKPRGTRLGSLNLMTL